MTSASHEAQHRAILERIAHRAMLERGLLPEFSRDVLAELEHINEPVLSTNGKDGLDLTKLIWCSIDNDDSRDLDQLTNAEVLPGDMVKIRVAIADVDVLVDKDCAIDVHASHNTTSVYTAATIFPMLPEKLSTDLTSLNYNEDRHAMVVEMIVDAGGVVTFSDVYPAWVHNHAKLAYNAVGAWLEDAGPIPEAAAAVPGLAENLRLQDRVAQNLRDLRQKAGALTLLTIKSMPVFDGDCLTDLSVQQKNRATDLIEDFMIASNGITARFLANKRYPSIRRVVRVPKRWDRIRELAAQKGYVLPAVPDPRPLDDFLRRERTRDALRFPDLSLAVIKLLGSGEYMAEIPGEKAPGHFGLAVRDYAHSTAPNRRFPDLITQRLLKAALAGTTPAYDAGELVELAIDCTEAENAVQKVERQVEKSADALLLEDRIGEKFEGIVTGAADKGTWVRLLTLPVEGKLVSGEEGQDVGDRLWVKLLEVDVERGFIDFARVM